MVVRVEKNVYGFRFMDYAVKKVLGIKYYFTVIDKTDTTIKVIAYKCDTNPLVSVLKGEEKEIHVEIDEQKNEEFITIFGIKVYASQFRYIL